MGKEKPLVSVIIPVYNTQDYLKACIESVQNQTYPNLEILQSSPKNIMWI